VAVIYPTAKPQAAAHPSLQFSAAYSTGKALVPLPHSVINALENTMSDLGGSLISSAQQQSEKVHRTLPLHRRCQEAHASASCFGTLTLLDHHIQPLWTRWNTLKACKSVGAQ
jgi:hypothetical protein